MNYRKTEKTRMSRHADRESYDRETVHSIIDESLFCVISYSVDDQPFAIPTGHARVGEYIYIHGSSKSHFLDQLTSDKPVCLTFSIMDGMVLAKSIFSHSFHYRSAIVFSEPEKVTDQDQKRDALEAFSEKYIPGRWDDVRQPNSGEMKATDVIRFRIKEASAKVSASLPKHKAAESELPIWTGILPLKKGFAAPQQDTRYTDSIPLPQYLKELTNVDDDM